MPSATLRDFVGGQRAVGLERGEHHLLDGARGLAGGDEAHGRADAAKVVGAAMRVGERFLRAVATSFGHGGFDLVDAGIELGGKTLHAPPQSVRRTDHSRNFPRTHTTQRGGPWHGEC